MPRTSASKVRIYDKLDTVFGVVTVFDRKNRKIMVLLDDDTTVTFNENEFFSDFVL